MRTPAIWTATALIAAAAFAAPVAEAGTSRGPSSSFDPFVVPTHPSVDTRSLVSSRQIGSAGQGYDGMAALPPAGTAVTAHVNLGRQPFKPVCVSSCLAPSVLSFTFDRQSHALLSSGSLSAPPPPTWKWDYPRQVWAAGALPSGGPNPRLPGDVFPQPLANFTDLTGASVTAPGMLKNPSTGNGYPGQITFVNEGEGPEHPRGEDENRVFGFIKTGLGQQLPRLGLFARGNTVAGASATDTTTVVGLERSASGQLWTYVGAKRTEGPRPADQAGLTGGANHVWDVVNEAVSTEAQFRATYGKGVAAPIDLAEINWDQSGARQNTDAAAAGLTLGPMEDGAFDPKNPNDFYFVTKTGGGAAPNPAAPTVPRDGGGLWKLSFADVGNPSLGATLTLLLDGSEAPYLSAPDNITIDKQGNVLIQEAPGLSAHIPRIIAYKISTKRRGVLAVFDPSWGPATSLSRSDEGISGITEVSQQFGAGWFLLNAERRIDEAFQNVTIEKQILLMKVNSWAAVYTFR